MLVWSGRGFLSIIVLFVTLFLCVAVLPKENADYGFVITAFVTALFSWFFGKKWNSKNERILVDEKTGERLSLKNNHSLFWIPLQYWGVIFGALGIIILFQNSVLFGSIASVILLGLVIAPLVMSKKEPISSPVRNTEREKGAVATNTNSANPVKSNRFNETKEDEARFMPK
jgi:hypothetical protein